MKKITTLLACLLMLVGTAFAQTELSAAQMQIRTDIKSFLESEGYAPTIDSDGDIKFKVEGKIYYISVSKKDTDPFYVALFRNHTYGETFTKEKIMNALGELNSNKGTKVLCFDSSYSYRSEMFIESAKPFKDVFSKLIRQIQMTSEDLAELM